MELRCCVWRHHTPGEGGLGRGAAAAWPPAGCLRLGLQASQLPKHWRLLTAPPLHCSLQVFEDTKHLIQSAVDGYNVCIFACERGCRAVVV